MKKKLKKYQINSLIGFTIFLVILVSACLGLLVLKIAFVSLGVLSFFYAIVVGYLTKKRLKNCKRTDGYISDYFETTDDSNCCVFIPVFKFLDDETQEYISFEGNNGYHTKVYEIGEKVNIITNKNNGKTIAYINSTSEIWGRTAAVFILSSVFTFIGIFI